MVAPAVGAALIGAAGSLLGGLFAPKPKWVTPNYQDIRNKAEAAGFNPLTALTSAPGQAMQGANYMGSAIADAGLMLADAFAKNKRGQTLSKVQTENDKLKERVQSLTLRPKVGGVYAARQAVPTVRQALGVKNAALAVPPVVASNGAVGSSVAGSATAAADLRPLPTVLDVDPRRAVDNKDVSTTSGFMVVDTPALPFPMYFPTADGDEPLQWYDYPSLALPLAGSAMKHAYDNYVKNNAPRPRDPAGVLAGKPRLPPSKVARVIPKSSREISVQEANRLRFGQWGQPHFGPLAWLK